jgi:hypothetical protein
MLSFELSAIDLILAIAVIILLILQLTNSSGNIFDQIFSKRKKRKQQNYEGNALKPTSEYLECPRGFGNIKKLNANNQVSERCLGCYQIMDCYSETE